jgi:hypothetical protein
MYIQGEVYQNFVASYCFLLQGRRVLQGSCEQVMFHSAYWLLHWLLNLEGGGVPSSECAVNFYQTIRLNIAEDTNLHSNCCENIKSHIRALWDLELWVTECAGYKRYLQRLRWENFGTFPEQVIYWRAEFILAPHERSYKERSGGN